MKVLGIAGSPRRGGNTDLLLAEVLRGAASNDYEVRTLFLSELEIAPCNHCDTCLTSGNCSIEDDMQMVYREIESADVLVLASPIHFMGISAQMKTVIDRCQALWARKYILKIPPLGDRRARKGLFISVGARRISELFEPALATIHSLFTVLNITYTGGLLFTGVEEKGAILKQPLALQQAYVTGKQLTEGAEN